MTRDLPFALLRRLALVLAAVGLIATATVAARAEADLSRVQQYVNSVSDLRGDFEQIGPDGQRITGQFFIKKPGKVRFVYHKPSRLEVISDGSNIAIRDRGLKTQELYRLNQTPLRVLLEERFDFRNDPRVLSIHQDQGFVTVIMEDKTVIGTSQIALSFREASGEIVQWVVRDPQGFDTTVRVSNLDTSKNELSWFQIDSRGWTNTVR